MKRLVLIVAVLAVLAGCGGASHPTRSVVVAGITHPCTAHDAAMQCVLPPTRLGAHLPPVGVTPLVYGVDFGWSCPVGAAHNFGASYLSYDTSKDWSLSCINSFHAAHKATVAVFEAGANDAQRGYSLGYAQAKRAAAILSTLSAPANQPFDMAVDCDCTGASLVGYFQGADRAEPGRVNAYGGYYQVLYLYQHRLVGHLNWQTYAWSGGRWLPASVAPLEQYLNSGSVDYDRAIASNYGQWPLPTPPKPRLRCFGPHAQLHNKTCERIRPKVSSWSHARDASHRVRVKADRALRANHCVRPYRRGVCVKSGRVGAVMRQREAYFQAQINKTLRTY